jgi:AraC-like DNA-binding protein
MKKISISELRYRNIDFEIADVFPENWIQRKEFSLYKTKARPYSALLFVCTDIEVAFLFDSNSPVFAKKGDIVFIPEGCMYNVNVTGKIGMKIDTYTVNFRLIDEKNECFLLSDKIEVLTNRQDNLLDVRLKNLSDIFYRVEKIENSLTRNFAKIKAEFFLLLDMIAESALQCKDFYYPIRKGVEAFCNEWNLNEKIEKYAQLCAMSETYFYRLFRKWSGSSPIEYRNMLRLSNAESMLRCTDMKIKEIAETVGFDDAFYFCHVFSQKFGMSPKKYRKNIQDQEK